MRNKRGKLVLAPRAGFEPATIRLTVECSTAELPRNRRKGVRDAERITKPSRLAKDEIGSSGTVSRRGRNSLRGNHFSSIQRSKKCDLAPHRTRQWLPRATNRAPKRLNARPSSTKPV